MNWYDNIPMGFEELEGSVLLNKEIIEMVKRARIEARDVIIHLEPEHITSFADLEQRLELSLEKARLVHTALSTYLP